MICDFKKSVNRLSCMFFNVFFVLCPKRHRLIRCIKRSKFALLLYSPIFSHWCLNFYSKCQQNTNTWSSGVFEYASFRVSFTPTASACLLESPFMSANGLCCGISNRDVIKLVPCCHMTISPLPVGLRVVDTVNGLF